MVTIFIFAFFSLKTIKKRRKKNENKKVKNEILAWARRSCARNYIELYAFDLRW